MRSYSSGMSPPLKRALFPPLPQVVSILRSLAVVDLEELLQAMFQLVRGGGVCMQHSVSGWGTRRGRGRQARAAAWLSVPSRRLADGRWAGH
jgi:hypothetical protein